MQSIDRHQHIVFSLWVVLCLLHSQCKGQNQRSPANHTDHTMNTNALINETSPYLLMHAHNPVNWYPWGKEALEMAKKENKLMIISIGYAACHWCHVMEEESFADQEVAGIMNERFVSIKVDREERPDIDHVYMDAVQLLTGSGGWPLNAIALPDGRPVFAGTYFTKEQWLSTLRKLSDLYISKSHMFEKQAEDIEQGLHRVNQMYLSPKTDPNMEGRGEIERLHTSIEKWKTNFDWTYGSTRGAPKFPMPTVLEFAYDYGHLYRDSVMQKWVELTLDQVAQGGIYDHIGGGFARYSVDERWHVPHFEKMLYDNAQLISLYTKVYKRNSQQTKYRNLIDETLEFVEREMSAGEGGFYCSIDADSQGEEGTFYVWRADEVDDILGSDSEDVKQYFHITDKGNWEEGKNVLFVDWEGTAPDDFLTIKQRLRTARDKRTRPALDNKVLTSWTALMITAYVDSYSINHNDDYKKRAIRAARFLQETMTDADGYMYRNYKDKWRSIPAFLDDYAHTIQAYIDVYEMTFGEQWLVSARRLTDYVIQHFYNEKTQLFDFVDRASVDKLVVNKIDVMDNVIPSSNAVMGHILHRMATYWSDDKYRTLSQQMLQKVRESIYQYVASYAHWGHLLTLTQEKTYEVVIAGRNAELLKREFDKYDLPDVIFMGTSSDRSLLPLVEGKYNPDKNMIYVCVNNVCKLPVETVEEALIQIESLKAKP